MFLGFKPSVFSVHINLLWQQINASGFTGRCCHDFSLTDSGPNSWYSGLWMLFLSSCLLTFCLVYFLLQLVAHGQHNLRLPQAAYKCIAMLESQVVFFGLFFRSEQTGERIAISCQQETSLNFCKCEESCDSSFQQLFLINFRLELKLKFQGYLLPWQVDKSGHSLCVCVCLSVSRVPHESLDRF